MSSFIVGGDCKVYYEDETGEILSQKLEEDKVYTIAVQAEYKGFEDDELIFEVGGKEMYIPVSVIKNIE